MPVDGDTDGAMLRRRSRSMPPTRRWRRCGIDALSRQRVGADRQRLLGGGGVYRYLDAIRRAGIATYFWGNWHDEPTGQVILGAANLGSKFLAGPGSHCVTPPGFDFTGEVVRYFDHYLKGVDNGIEGEPRATYWVEGVGGKGGYVKSAQLPGVRRARSPGF